MNPMEAKGARMEPQEFALNIHGVPWTVKFVDKTFVAPDGDECTGYCCFNTHTVTVSLKHPDHVVKITFWHEITHACHYVMIGGVVDDKIHVEASCDLVSTAMPSILEQLTQRKKIFKYLSTWSTK